MRQQMLRKCALVVVGVLATLSASPGVGAEQDDRPELLLQAAHIAGVKSIAFSPDGKLVASADHGGIVKIWQPGTGQVVKVLAPERRTWQPCVAFSPDGDCLAVGLESEGVLLYDRQSWRLERRLQAMGQVVACLAFSPDSELVAAAWYVAPDYSPARASEMREGIQLWETRTGRELARYTDHDGAVSSVAFSSDGTRLVSVGRDGVAAVREIPSGRTLNRVDLCSPGAMTEPASLSHAAPISADGERLAVCCDGGNVAIWLVGKGERLSQLRLKEDESIGLLALSPDGHLLASSGSNGAQLWDVESGEAVRRYGHGCSALAFSADGSFIALGQGDGALRILDATASDELMAIEQGVDPGSGSAFSPDGKRLALVSEDRAVVVWETDTGELLCHDARSGCGRFATAFSPDGDLLVAGCWAGLDLRDTNTWESLGTLYSRPEPGDEHAVSALAFSPDGKWLASGQGRLVKLWDMERREHVRSFEGFVPYRDRGLAFSHDGTLLAAADGATIRVWDPHTGEGVHALAGHAALVTCLAFVPDREELLSGSLDRTVRVWDLGTGECMRVLDVGIDTWAIHLVPGGHRLLVHDYWRGALQTWDLDAGRKLQERQLGPGFGLVVSSDGTRLARTELKGMALYKGEAERVLAYLVSLTGPGGSCGGYLVTTPEGYYTGSAEAARLITWQVGDQVFPVEAFRDVFYRPDLVAKSLRGEPLGEDRVLTNDDIPPGVKIMAPEELASVAGGSVAISVVAHGLRRIAHLEVYANGRRVSADVERGLALDARGIALDARDLPRQHKLTKTFFGTVPLPPGEKRVTLRFVAVDKAGFRSRPAEVTVLQHAVHPVRGELHMLAVGISEYANPEYNLSVAAKDAQAIAESVRQQAGPDRLYSRAHSRLLTNSSATAEAVRKELGALRSAAAPEDTVVLFVSGHGLRDEGHNYYFATHETALEKLEQTALLWTELQALVRELRAKHVLVLLDTCHAAAALGSYAATNQALGEMLADRAGVMVLASSSAAERSYESEEWGHGAFTKALLEALGGEAGEQLSPGILEDFVGARVAELTNNRQHPYVPIRTQFPAGTPLLLAD